MWDFIINPFITILTFLYSVLGNNIVLAIVVFTIIIRLVTSPLMMKQQKSAKAMQELQPRLKKLQEKYKNDREKMAVAQMELYKQYGINPLGGCLPLLIQFPILIGLYRAISLALANSPNQLMQLSGRLLVPGLDHLVPLNNIWLGMDLTQAPGGNPTYAMMLPLLVVTTTWLQSKLTMPPPSKGDTSQSANMTRSMTTIMPLMFGFFSLSFSVGISIYFVVSNLVGIAQSTLTGKAEWRALFRRGSRTEKTAESPMIVEGKATPVRSDAKDKATLKVDGKSEEGTIEVFSPRRKKKTRKMQKNMPENAE